MTRKPLLSPHSPLPTFGEREAIPTPRELRRIYERAEAAKPVIAAMMRFRLQGKEKTEAETEAENELATKAIDDSLLWITTHRSVGRAWLGNTWEPQARAMLEVLPRFDTVESQDVAATLYGGNNGDAEVAAFIIGVQFDAVGVPYIFHMCRPRPQEPLHHSADRAAYDRSTSVWSLADTFDPANTEPYRQWVLRFDNTNDPAANTLINRLLDMVRANPTPSHISLNRAFNELAGIAIGQSHPTPTLDALARVWPQVEGARAKAQAYAEALEQEQEEIQP